MSKNYKGGYKIISLLGASLVAGESVTIAGIHKAIEASYRKPLLIEGIVIDGVEKNATFVKELKVVEGSYVIEIYGLELTITDEDEVAVRELHAIKSITTDENVMELDIHDGDELLLASTNDIGTEFMLPQNTYIVGLTTNGINEEYIYSISTTSGPQISVGKDRDIFVKRVGSMILVSYNMEL